MVYRIVIILFTVALISKEPGFVFLKVPFDPKVTALCESVVACVGEPGAFVYNPSLLATLMTTRISANYIHYFESLGFYNTVFTVPYRKINFGLDIKYFGFSDDAFDLYLRKVGDILHNYGVITTAFSALEKNYALGVGIKYAYQSILFGEIRDVKHLPLIDIGGLYLGKNDFIGLSFINLSSNLSEVPFTVRFGGMHAFRGYKLYWDISRATNRQFKIALGVEWNILPLEDIIIRRGKRRPHVMFNLIGGLSYELQRDLRFGLGASLGYFGFRIDYSLSLAPNLGLTHRFGIKCKL